MKALVTYYSETGNTERIAKAIYEGIGKEQKEMIPLDEVGDVTNYEVIFLGFPVHASSVPGKVQQFLKDIPDGKKVAIFATHGSLRGGPLAVAAFDYAVTLASRAKVLGVFGCRGRVKASLLDALMEKPEHRAWALEAQSSAAVHPDDADMEDATEFAMNMMGKAHAL